MTNLDELIEKDRAAAAERRRSAAISYLTEAQALIKQLRIEAEDIRWNVELYNTDTVGIALLLALSDARERGPNITGTPGTPRGRGFTAI